MRTCTSDVYLVCNPANSLSSYLAGGASLFQNRMSLTTAGAYELLHRMSDAALVDVVRNMSNRGGATEAEKIVRDALQHDIRMKESIEEARCLRCSRCGAAEDMLVRRPHLSQTLICSACGTDTMRNADFDEGRTYAYDDEDPDSAPHAQFAVSVFGEADSPEPPPPVTGKRRWRADSIANARESDRSDMVAALSGIIKAHARNALLAPDGSADAQQAPLLEVPYEQNARLRTRLFTEARRRILNALRVLRAASAGVAPRSMVVPRYRSIYNSGAAFLRNVAGEWVGSRDACLDVWRYVVCDWYRQSGIQQRNYHVFMLVAIVRAGLRTGCAIPPERCVFEMSQCLGEMERTGLSSITSIDFGATVRRFYDRWGRIVAGTVAPGKAATFPIERPSCLGALLATNRAAHTDPAFAWCNVVMSHIRWFAASAVLPAHAHALVRAAERRTIIVWERRHLLNQTKRDAHAAFQHGHPKLHCFWRYLREPERLSYFEPLYRKAFDAPWFTDAPVFRDSGAWACALLCLLPSALKPRGVDICDYFGRRARDIMPFVAAIEAVDLLV